MERCVRGHKFLLIYDNINPIRDPDPGQKDAVPVTVAEVEASDAGKALDPHILK